MRNQRNNNEIHAKSTKTNNEINAKSIKKTMKSMRNP